MIQKTQQRKCVCPVVVRIVTVCSGWCWHPLYEKLKCGKPKAMAAQNSTGWWVRSFDHCEVSLNQKSNAYTIMQQGELVAWNH